MTTTDLLAGQTSELERLTAQCRAWEPAGRAVLDELPDGDGLRVLDVGCGALGWLRILADWVGPHGTVVGVRRTIVELGPEDDYLRLPLQFAPALEGRIAAAIGAAALEELRAAAAVELDDPSRRGTSFALVSAWGRLPA